MRITKTRLVTAIVMSIVLLAISLPVIYHIYAYGNQVANSIASREADGAIMYGDMTDDTSRDALPRE